MSSDRETAIRDLVATIDAYLGGFDGPGIAHVRAGIVRWKDGPLQDVAPARIAAVRHLDSALAWMREHGQATLASAIKQAAPWLEWRPYDSYPRDLIGERFADDHCFASIIGGDAPLRAEDFDLGLFIIGPDILYRDHNHAAPELYAPLTGPHGFRFARGEALTWLPAHQPVWNEAFRQHAIKSGPVPFLCVFGWTRDVDALAQIIIEPDWSELETIAIPA